MTTYRNTIEDINSVIKNGIKRPIPCMKQDIHYGEFVNLCRLLTSIGLNAGIFIDGLSMSDFYSQSQIVLNRLVKSLLANAAQRNYLDDAYDYLCQDDPLERADWIFVFGSKNFDRPKKAAELFLQGFANKIYCSGSRPVEEEKREHEGRKFREYIIANFNISDSDIVADPNDNSMTMADNVRGFLNFLDTLGKPPLSTIVVSTAHNLRRGWGIFSKYSSDIRISRCSSGFMTGVERDNWYKTEIGIKLVYEEYEKIKLQHITNTS